MFNIIVIEGQKDIDYNCQLTLHPDIPFNYNQFMNMGAQYGTAKYIAFCNNDLEFFPGWATKIIEGMEQNDAVSASPFCKELYGNRLIGNEFFAGTEVGEGGQVEGWCLVLRRDFFMNTLKGFDEDFAFYCADNSFAEQLKNLGIKHYLFTRSIVNHLSKATILTVKGTEFDELTRATVQIFNKKYNQNKFGYGNGDN